MTNLPNKGLGSPPGVWEKSCFVYVCEARAVSPCFSFTAGAVTWFPPGGGAAQSPFEFSGEWLTFPMLGHLGAHYYDLHF